MRANHWLRLLGAVTAALLLAILAGGTAVAQPDIDLPSPGASPSAVVLRAEDLATRAAVEEVAKSDATSVTLVVDDQECVLTRASTLDNLAGPCSALPHPSGAVVFQGGRLELKLDKGQGRIKAIAELELADDGGTLTVTAARFVQCKRTERNKQSCVKWEVVARPEADSLAIEAALAGAELDAKVHGRSLTLSLEEPDEAIATLHKDGYLVLRRTAEVTGSYGGTRVLQARSTATLFERVEPGEADDEDPPDIRHWGSLLLGLYFAIVVTMFWISTKPPSAAALRARAASLRAVVDIAAARSPKDKKNDAETLDEIRRSIVDLLDSALEDTSWSLFKRSKPRQAGLLIERAARLRLHLENDLEIDVRLRSALAETHKLPAAKRKVWAGQTAALFAKQARPSYRRAALLQLSAQLEAADDARAETLVQLQNKTFLLTLTGTIAAWVLVYNDFGVLLFAGAVGGLIGRFSRVKSAAAQSDSGLSWALVTASPIVGALFAWAGLVLMALLKRMNIVDFAGISDLELSTLMNPGVVVLGLALLFSISERLLDRVVARSLEGILPDGQGAAAEAPPPPPPSPPTPQDEGARDQKTAAAGAVKAAEAAKTAAAKTAAAKTPAAQAAQAAEAAKTPAAAGQPAAEVAPQVTAEESGTLAAESASEPKDRYYDG